MHLDASTLEMLENAEPNSWWDDSIPDMAGLSLCPPSLVSCQTRGSTNEARDERRLEFDTGLNSLFSLVNN